MERFTGKITGSKCCGHAVPVTFGMDFVFGMTDRDYQEFMALVDRLYEYEETGLTPEEITAMAGNLRQINEAKEREARVADMVDLASHAIGLDNKKAYYRHGKYWYKPYRNYYCSGSAGDPAWEEMVEQGYAKASRGLGSTYYHMTRAGLDWLGQQTNIKIHDMDPED